LSHLTSSLPLKAQYTPQVILSIAHYGKELLRSSLLCGVYEDIVFETKEAELLLMGLGYTSCALKICWNYFDSLESSMKILFQSSFFADTPLVLGNKRYMVHAFVLRARCPALLDSNVDTIIKDCPQDLFEIFLQFLYTNNPDCLPLDNYFLADLFNALGVRMNLPPLSMESKDTDIDIQLSGELVVRVHRAMLSTRSAYFRSLFSSNTREVMQNLIDLSEYDQVAMLAILQWIYTDKLPEPATMEDSLNLWVLADFFQLPQDTKLLCEAHFYTTVHTLEEDVLYATFKEFSLKPRLVRVNEKEEFVLNHGVWEDLTAKLEHSKDEEAKRAAAALKSRFPTLC